MIVELCGSWRDRFLSILNCVIILSRDLKGVDPASRANKVLICVPYVVRSESLSIEGLTFVPLRVGGHGKASAAWSWPISNFTLRGNFIGAMQSLRREEKRQNRCYWLAPKTSRSCMVASLADHVSIAHA
jgi:hypothetical protein